MGKMGEGQGDVLGLKHIESWLAKGNWNIVQFNWGVWGLCYRHPDSKVQGKKDKEKGTITFKPKALYRKVV